MSADLIELVQRLGQPRVLILGDLMLDRYVWGDAERISQEAPVILLRADKREERLGGASSVATMIRALGARVSLVGVVGRDADAERVRAILTNLGIEQDGILTDESRPTTVKERYIGRAQHRHPQQMLRVDFETREALESGIEARMMQTVAEQIRFADIVLISDYDKGVCTPRLLAATIAAAKAKGIRVVADPIRGKDYSKYHGCSAMTPNRLEAGLATGLNITTNAIALEAAAQLQRDLDLEVGIVTLDKDGMAMVHRDGRRQIFPTRPRQVYDIAGAGDMVMSTMGMTLAAGADFDQAIRLANIAGGLEVEKIGVATVTRDEILADLIHGTPTTQGMSKIVDVPTLLQLLQQRRQVGQRVAFTNGCFDVLHIGHVRYLQQARSQADVLVVGLNSDQSVRMLKGNTRPINGQCERAAVLAGLQSCDFIVIFDDLTPASLIQTVRPDVLVKGADYRKEDIVGADFVESYGGRVYLAPLEAGVSTTRMIDRMRAA